MIGRAALGNPWIIYEITQKLAGNFDIAEPTVNQKLAMCQEHYTRLAKLKGPDKAIKEMRKHTAWYLKGIRGANKMRNQIGQINTREDLLELFDQIRKIDETNKIPQSN
jgi:tRNA-dihydrouridine synthase